VRGSAVKTFKLSIEQDFLRQLSDEELKAVVAHELGHVWIYTHHPYLQTEQQANQIAMRIVTRDALVKVYGKVWADASAAGTLKRFPDEPATSLGLGPQRQP
jgi:predicted Zn-dependent protease